MQQQVYVFVLVIENVERGDVVREHVHAYDVVHAQVRFRLLFGEQTYQRTGVPGAQRKYRLADIEPLMPDTRAQRIA